MPRYENTYTPSSYIILYRFLFIYPCLWSSLIFNVYLRMHSLRSCYLLCLGCGNAHLTLLIFPLLGSPLMKKATREHQLKRILVFLFTLLFSAVLAIMNLTIFLQDSSSLRPLSVSLSLSLSLSVFFSFLFIHRRRHDVGPSRTSDSIVVGFFCLMTNGRTTSTMR